MLRLRFLIAAALLALVGCGPQVATPTTEAPTQAAAPTTEVFTPTAEPSIQPEPATATPPTGIDTSTPEPSPTVELTHEEDLSGKPFMLRNLDPGFKDMYKSDYPAAITRLRDSDLQGFRCTRDYVDMTGQSVTLSFPDETTQSNHPLTDATLVGLAASINEDHNHNPDQQVVGISACETEIGHQQIVLYRLGGDALSGRSYIGIVDGGKVVQIGAPEFHLYVDCKQVLAVDRSSNLYYQCDGGDGGGHHTYVYRVNLAAHEETLLVYCQNMPLPNGLYCE